jgi:Ricin-type beta-trefoil lectin domain/GDSL-like Lipase/Acylhydrolase family
MRSPRLGIRVLGAAFAALTLVLGLAVTSPLSPAQAATTVKVMPLGDSITGSPGCWRSVLWNRLQSNNVKNVDFVGSLNNNGSCSQSFDGDNEGHGGFLARDIVGNNNLPGWLNSAKPDVVLMHLGTNDVWNNIATNTILGYYSTLVDQMRANNSKMRILVAKITPMAPAGCSTCTQGVVNLDNAIQNWANGKTTSASPITVVDQFTGYNDSTDTIDGVHPNASGNQKISNNWYSPLVSAINAVAGTTPTPTPSASSTGGTSTGTTFALKGTQSGRCIDVPGSSTTNGTALALWDCNGGTNQKWQTTSANELKVYGTKCLDVSGQGTANGSVVQIWDCNGQANQKWTINSDGTIKGTQSGRCLDVSGQATANNSPIALWDCNGQTNQKWSKA